MLAKISILVFWLIFFGFFLIFIGPKPFLLLENGWPEYMGNTWLQKRLWFSLHIIFGTVVYVTGLIQFTPSIRNKNIKLHRKLGKLYIISSLICIGTLTIILPQGLCEACRPSQYIVTSLWLVFIVLAYYFIRQRKILQHQRMMIRSYICAAYFVTVRIVDHYMMGFFKAVFPNPDDQYLYSDMSVWLVPLILFQVWWIYSDRQAAYNKSILFLQPEKMKSDL